MNHILCQNSLSDPVKGLFVMLPAYKQNILCIEGQCCADWNFNVNVKHTFFAFIVPEVTKVTRVIHGEPTVTKVTRIIEGQPSITKVTRVVSGKCFVFLNQYVNLLNIIYRSKKSKMLSSTGPQYSVSTGTTNINLEGQ